MAEGQVIDSNPVAVAEAPVTGQAPAASTGTVEPQNGQATAGQSAPAEEQFSNIDPKTLPPELQAVYKNLQSDYTKKTQSIAETRKKAEAFEKLQGDEQISAYLKGLNKGERAQFREQKAEAEKRLGEKITDERFQKAWESKDSWLELIAEVAKETSQNSQKKIEALEQKLSVKDAKDFVDSFATELGQDGKAVRPDFDALDEDQLITGFLQINPPKELTAESYRERLTEAYGWAKTVSTKYYEKGKQDALARIQQKVVSSTNPPTQAAKGAYTGPDPKKLTVREAMDLARKGQKVPQVYD